jgi:hypothetical protein
MGMALRCFGMQILLNIVNHLQKIILLVRLAMLHACVALVLTEKIANCAPMDTMNSMVTWMNNLLIWWIQGLTHARQVDLAMNVKETAMQMIIAQEILFVSQEMVMKKYLDVVPVLLLVGTIAITITKLPWLTMVDARGADLAVNVKEIVILMKNVMGI